jgi:chromosome partitioning protein
VLVIGVVQSKGGVGKSTLCCNLAVAARATYSRVAILDTDPQHTTAIWWKLRGEPDDITVFADAASPREGVDALRNDGWDVVIIDTPGQFLSLLRDAAQASDFVIMPMRPGLFDVSASRDGITICEQTKVPYAVVFNGIVKGEKFAVEIRAHLISEDVPVLDTEVSYRPSYISSVQSGRAAGEMPGAHAAKAEMAGLWAEILAKARASRKVAAHG